MAKAAPDVYYREPTEKALEVAIVCRLANIGYPDNVVARKTFDEFSLGLAGGGSGGGGGGGRVHFTVV
jgi:hypothetical protein